MRSFESDDVTLRNPPRRENAENEENETTGSKEIEAVITDKAREDITIVFSELHDSWAELQNLKPMITTSNLLRNENIDAKINAMKIMKNDEIFDLIRIDFIKMDNLEKQVESLTRQLRETSQMYDLAENRVATAQKSVFEKMENTIRTTLDKFHSREVDLVEKTTILEKKLAKTTAKADQFEKKTENLEKMNSSLEKKLEELKLKNELLVKNNEELHLIENNLTKKLEVETADNMDLQASVRRLMEELLEAKNEVVEKSKDVELLKTVAKKEVVRSQERAKQFEDEVTEQCNSFRDRVQREKDNEIMEKERHIKFLKAEANSQLVKMMEENKKLKEEVVSKQKKLDIYNKNFQLYRSQIEGDVRRKLTWNYRQVMHDFHDGPNFDNRVPSMSSDDIVNMFSSLEKDLEKEKENDRAQKESSSRPPMRNEQEKSRDAPLRSSQTQTSKPPPSRAAGGLSYHPNRGGRRN